MTIKKAVKYLFLTGSISLLLGLAFWLVVKNISTKNAQTIAEGFIADIDRNAFQSEDDKIIALASDVFENFTRQNPSEVTLLRLRPYVTNHRLPDFLKLQSGVIETNISKGYCDNAARMLAFILSQEGIESVQWNMVTDRSGHSALLVTLTDGRQGLVDPFYGYAAVDKDGKLIHPNDAMNKLESGERFDTIFKPLGTDASPQFYNAVAKFYMAAEGQPLKINATLPRLREKGEIFLGQIDGNEKDVKAAAVENNMTPYWNYVGHRYNREWVRTLTAIEPVKLEMLLVLDAEAGILTSEPAPKVNGNKLTWELSTGDTITFHDGRAKVSLARMNSYIGVDQIIIQRLP